MNRPRPLSTTVKFAEHNQSTDELQLRGRNVSRNLANHKGSSRKTQKTPATPTTHSSQPPTQPTRQPTPQVNMSDGEEAASNVVMPEDSSEAQKIMIDALSKLTARIAVLDGVNKEIHTNQQAVASSLKQKNITKHLQPDEFYGNPSDDALKFMNRFETHADLSEHYRENKPKVFRLLLRGPAEIWYHSLPADCKDDWDKLKEEFEKTFGGTENQWMLEQRLDNRSQKRGEQADDYIQDMLQQAQRLRKSNEETKKLIIRGLQPAIKRYVLGQNPKSLDATLEAVRLGETIANIDDNKSVNVVRSPLDDLSDLKKEILAAVTAAKTSAAREESRPAGGLNDKDIACYSCGRFGHLSRSCPEKEDRRSLSRPRDPPPPRRFDDRRGRRRNDFASEARRRMPSYPRRYDPRGPQRRDDYRRFDRSQNFRRARRWEGRDFRSHNGPSRRFQGDRRDNRRYPNY